MCVTRVALRGTSTVLVLGHSRGQLVLFMVDLPSREHVVERDDDMSARSLARPHVRPDDLGLGALFRLTHALTAARALRPG